MRLFTILLFSFYAHLLMADAPGFDIYKFKINNEVYYTAFRNQQADINVNDLCFYGYQNEYIMEAEVYLINELLNLLENKIQLVLFKDLIEIKASKLANGQSYFENFFQFENEITFTKFGLIPKLELISVVRDTEPGMTCTPDLNEEDNYWIEEYPTVHLFQVSTDNQICSYDFYGIEGNHTKASIERLKNRLQKILSKSYDDFYEELDVLHKQNVIMLGYCGC